MFILGVAISLIGVLLSLYFKGITFSVLLSPAAIVLHIFVLAAVLTATQSFKTFWYGLKAVVLPNEPLADEVRGQAASLFRLLSKTTVMSSIIGLIIGIISALANMYDVEALSHGIGASFASTLLGMFLIFAVFEPVVFILKKRHGEARHSKPKRLSENKFD